MSFVIAAMSYFSGNVLHSASISAVLPVPTGPPTPTRSGPWGDIVMSETTSYIEFRAASRPDRIETRSPPDRLSWHPAYPPQRRGSSPPDLPARANRPIG